MPAIKSYFIDEISFVQNKAALPESVGLADGLLEAGVVGGRQAALSEADEREQPQSRIDRP